MVGMDGLAVMSSGGDVYRRLGLDSDQFVNAVGSRGRHHMYSYQLVGRTSHAMKRCRTVM